MSADVFEVPAGLAASAFIDNAKYLELYQRSITDPDAFWASMGSRLDWIRPFTRVKNASWDPHNVSIRWYEDGILNVAYNCVDRHAARTPDKVAILWEGDDPSEQRAITYAELQDEVCRFANVLKAAGVKRGDRVTIYLPMIPEAASPCWPRLASVPSIRWCSPVSRRTASPAASAMPAARW